MQDTSKPCMTCGSPSRQTTFVYRGSVSGRMMRGTYVVLGFGILVCQFLPCVCDVSHDAHEDAKRAFFTVFPFVYEPTGLTIRGHTAPPIHRVLCAVHDFPFSFQCSTESLRPRRRTNARGHPHRRYRYILFSVSAGVGRHHRCSLSATHRRQSESAQYNCL